MPKVPIIVSDEAIASSVGTPNVRGSQIDGGAGNLGMMASGLDSLSSSSNRVSRMLTAQREKAEFEAARKAREAAAKPKAVRLGHVSNTVYEGFNNAATVNFSAPDGGEEELKASYEAHRKMVDTAPEEERKTLSNKLEIQYFRHLTDLRARGGREKKFDLDQLDQKETDRINQDVFNADKYVRRRVHNLWRKDGKPVEKRVQALLDDVKNHSDYKELDDAGKALFDAGLEDLTKDLIGQTIGLDNARKSTEQADAERQTRDDQIQITQSLALFDTFASQFAEKNPGIGLVKRARESVVEAVDRIVLEETPAHLQDRVRYALIGNTVDGMPEAGSPADQFATAQVFESDRRERQTGAEAIQAVADIATRDIAESGDPKGSYDIALGAFDLIQKRLGNLIAPEDRRENRIRFLQPLALQVFENVVVDEPSEMDEIAAEFERVDGFQDIVPRDKVNDFRAEAKEALLNAIPADAIQRRRFTQKILTKLSKGETVSEEDYDTARRMLVGHAGESDVFHESIGIVKSSTKITSQMVGRNDAEIEKLAEDSEQYYDPTWSETGLNLYKVTVQARAIAQKLSLHTDSYAHFGQRPEIKKQFKEAITPELKAAALETLEGLYDKANLPESERKNMANFTAAALAKIFAEALKSSDNPATNEAITKAALHINSIHPVTAEDALQNSRAWKHVFEDDLKDGDTGEKIDIDLTDGAKLAISRNTNPDTMGAKIRISQTKFSDRNITLEQQKTWYEQIKSSSEFTDLRAGIDDSFGASSAAGNRYYNASVDLAIRHMATEDYDLDAAINEAVGKWFSIKITSVGSLMMDKTRMSAAQIAEAPRNAKFLRDVFASRAEKMGTLRTEQGFGLEGKTLADELREGGIWKTNSDFMGATFYLKGSTNIGLDIPVMRPAKQMNGDPLIDLLTGETIYMRISLTHEQIAEEVAEFKDTTPFYDIWGVEFFDGL